MLCIAKERRKALKKRNIKNLEKHRKSETKTKKPFTFLYGKVSLHKKWGLPVRVSLVNVTKSAVFLRIW